MANRNRLLLSLALGADQAKKVEKLPKLDAKEAEIVRRGYRRNGMNNPGRS